MDRFASYVRTNQYDVRVSQPRKANIRGSIRILNGKITYHITYDKFDKFISEAKPNDSYEKDFVIFDETVPNTIDEKLKRLYLLEKINSMPNVRQIIFYTSDDSFRLYNELMKRMNWRYKDVTSLILTINRNPSQLASLRLDEAQGKIIGLGQDDLIWLPDNVIRTLSEKLYFNYGKANNSDLEDAIRLKRFIVNYANILESKYHFQRLTEFDKMFLVYNDIHNIIRFAGDRTMSSRERGCIVLKPSESRYESKPYGTLTHKSGVCEGQSRLYRSMLFNPYLDVNCQLISGSIPTGESHMWTGVVVNDELYQVCLTMQGMFGNVDRAGYKPYSNEIYPTIYPHAFLTIEDKSRIERHVRSLKK